MGFTFNKKLPIPKEIKAMYPLSPENAAKKAQRDKEIRDGTDLLRLDEPGQQCQQH